MALEAIGLGLGAASFAADLTVAIVKLKQLWDEVKDVPDEIRSTLETLEVIDLTLQDLRNQINHDAVPSELRQHVLKLPLELSRRAHTSLQEVISDLDVELQASKGFRKRFVAMKVVIRKPTLKQLEKKLKSALEALALAVRNFELALIMNTRQLIVERLPLTVSASMATAPVAPSTKPDVTPRRDEIEIHSEWPARASKKGFRSASAFDTAAVWLGRLSYSSGPDGHYQLVIRTPSWLTGSVHVAIAQRCVQGWQVSLRTHCVISNWDDVAGVEFGSAFVNDDPAALRRVLQGHGLPLLTRDTDGLSLPLLAVSFCSTNILRDLFDLGVGLDHSEYASLFTAVLKRRHLEGDFDCDVRDLFLWFVLCSNDFGAVTGLDLSQTRRLETMNSFAIQSCMDDMLRVRGLVVFVGLLQMISAPDLQLYQQWFLPGLSLAERLKCARHIPLRKGASSYRARELRALVPELWAIHSEGYSLPVPACTRFVSHERHFALHLAAREMGLSQSASALHSDREHWSQVLQHLFRPEVADIQSLEPYSTFGTADQGVGQTPLLTYLCAVMEVHLADRISMQKIGSSVAEALRQWLTLVKEAGVDLRAYGSEEGLIYEYTGLHGRFWSMVDHLARYDHIRLISLGYGAEPTDWRLWWAPEYEELAGLFWDMAENPQLSLPGSWVEEAEVNSDDEWTSVVVESFNWIEVR